MMYVILIILVLFVIEVVLGSCIDVYNAEIGYAAKCDQPTRLSPKHFFTQLLPIILLFVILPFILLSDIF
ncbi:hypothetical protein [Desulfocastanea catecholica]